METSVQDRFATLFATAPVPAASDPGQRHLFEVEQDRMQQQTGWKIPEVAQTPRKIRGPAPKPAGGDNILTSEDENDDYVSSFAQKPKMLTPTKKMNQKPKPRKTPEPDAHGYPKDAYVEPEAPIRYIPDRDSNEDEDSDSTSLQLRTSDKLGNPITGHFCQFSLVKKFPYKYMVDGNDRVSRHFFANNKFFERTWDLYYIHPPQSLYRDVVLLLPLSQVQALIQEISTTFKAEVCVPGFPFTLSFFDDSTPQPQLLGTTRSRADINDMQDKILPPPEGHGEAPAGASPAVDYSFAAFKKKMDKALAANKKKASAVKKKKAQDRFLVIQDWCKQLRRAQRYLGLRPRIGKVPEPDPNMSWVEQEAVIKEHEKKAHIVLDPLDVTKLAPFSFEEEPIIISIDIESYERAHSLITEIGISTLDTLDLVNTALGDGGGNWMKHIRSRHFRIKGREHLINKEFVTGHPDEFQFGDSEFVSLTNAGSAIDSCFEWPFSVQYKHDGRLKNMANDWNTSAATSGTNEGVTAYTRKSTSYGNSSDPATAQLGPRKRTILLLGHDLGTDLSYLATLGSRTFSAPRPPVYPQPHIDPADIDNPVHSILEALDTATLYKVLTRESQTRSLTSIMGDLGRTAWYAHCGGNDARYTLEALVGMVIKARIQDDQQKAAQQVAIEKALGKNGWEEASTPSSTTANVGAEDGPVDGNVDIPGEDVDGKHGIVTQSTNASTHSTTEPSNPGPPNAQSSWEEEKARRLATRLAAAQREVEEEHEAWDTALAFKPSTSPVDSAIAGIDANSKTDTAKERTNLSVTDDLDENNAPIPFSAILRSTHDAKQKKAAKKSAEEKRREWEMRVRTEDGVAGPVDWSVGGKDGCGK